MSAAVARVVRQDLVSTLQIASEFRPFQEVDVHAKVAGYVKVINVDIGDRVRQGQLLAVLEVPELEQDRTRALAAERRSQEDIRRAQSEIRRYQAIARQAQITYRRMASVNERSPNLVAQQEIDVAQAQADAAAAELSAREATLSAAVEQLAEAQAREARAATFAEYAKIIAPFDGVVTKRYADTGAMVAQGTQSNQQAMPVVRVVQVDPLRLSFPVPESLIPLVHVGVPLQIYVPALKRDLQAKVWRFSGKADDATRTMETQLLIGNPSFELKPGMLATVEFIVDQRKAVLAMPIEAVPEGGAHQRAEVLLVNADNRVESRHVELGLHTATKYEVRSGLAEHDRVIIAARSQFHEGQTVVPKVVSFDTDPKDRTAQQETTKAEPH